MTNRPEVHYPLHLFEIICNSLDGLEVTVDVGKFYVLWVINAVPLGTVKDPPIRVSLRGPGRINHHERL